MTSRSPHRRRERSRHRSRSPHRDAHSSREDRRHQHRSSHPDQTRRRDRDGGDRRPRHDVTVYPSSRDRRRETDHVRPRSPRRDRYSTRHVRRSQSPDANRQRSMAEDKRSRRRSRSRSRRRSPSRPTPPSSSARVVDTSNMGSEEAMMAMLGFGSFGTTKGQHVQGNDAGDASIKLKRQYRQYMNRRGGFNRPLDNI
ncbi:hypothetical protein H4R35_001897 [Dimargaris xerosporica]|nr:hypothetical protein H4R35_001897 [Dimargaris xerosporica]